MNSKHSICIPVHACCIVLYAFWAFLILNNKHFLLFLTVTEEVLSVTPLTCCLQCFLQECGLTAEMIHLENKSVLGQCLQGILIR